MDMTALELKFATTAEHGEVSAILDRTDASRSLLVLGHGSGSNMHVPFITGLSAALVSDGVATFRYEFPYSERADFVAYSDIEMDAPEVLLATVRSAVSTASAMAPDLPLFAGGHSVSGLMTSVANSESPFPTLHGLVILGFPLKRDMERAAHLANATHPVLLIQRTEDMLGKVDQIKQVVKGQGLPPTSTSWSQPGTGSASRDGVYGSTDRGGGSSSSR